MHSDGLALTVAYGQKQPSRAKTLTYSRCPMQATHVCQSPLLRSHTDRELKG